METAMEITIWENYVNSLVIRMGIQRFLNPQFAVLQGVRRAGDVARVTMMIHQFCDRIERSLPKIINYLAQPNTGYNEAIVCAGYIHTEACRVGARSIMDISFQFLIFCAARNFQRCALYLRKLYYEYTDLRLGFTLILKMELKIFRLKHGS